MNKFNPIKINNNFLEFENICYNLDQISSYEIKKSKEPFRDELKHDLIALLMAILTFIFLPKLYASIISLVIFIKFILDIKKFYKTRNFYNLIIIFKSNTELNIKYVNKIMLDETINLLKNKTSKNKKEI